MNTKARTTTPGSTHTRLHEVKHDNVHAHDSKMETPARTCTLQQK